MKSTLRRLALVYAAVLLLQAAWAWIAAVRFQDLPKEQLLPDLLLSIVAWPSSLTLGVLTFNFPVPFANSFVQVGWLTFCGIFQLSVLFLLSSVVSKGNAAA